MNEDEAERVLTTVDNVYRAESRRVLEEAEGILGEVGANIFRCTRYNENQARRPRSRVRRRRLK